MPLTGVPRATPVYSVRRPIAHLVGFVVCGEGGGSNPWYGMHRSRVEFIETTKSIDSRQSSNFLICSKILSFFPPNIGLLCDLLWSDPDKDIQGWGENDRGVSFTFGADVVSKFLNRHDLDLICRAHQVVEDGYEFFAKRQLVTLFSAPNYCGEFDNAGGMMSVDETLMCSFQVCRYRDR